MKAQEYVTKFNRQHDAIVTVLGKEGRDIIVKRNCQELSAKRAVVKEITGKYRKVCEIIKHPFIEEVAYRGFSRLIMKEG